MNAPRLGQGRVALRCGRWAAGALAFCALTACVHNKPAAGELISASLPIHAYAEARRHGSGEGTVKLVFPLLEIYDGSGALLYHGNEPAKNARVLRDFPSSFQSLGPRPAGPRLVDILEAAPDLRAKEQEILRRHSPVVLSVVLENCHACSVQEEALGEQERHLLQQSVNVLIIHVSSS